MAARVGINGFGRVGRMVLRAIMQEKEFNNIDVVAINSLQELDYMAYMLKYDSVHGRFNGEIRIENGYLVVNDRKIHVSAHKTPNYINWISHDVDIVIEATGVFLTKESCQAHLDAGAKIVVQSAPSKDDTPMFVYGVNSDDYKGEAIISAASCTTNGLAPIIKVLNDCFGVKRGLMTTIHAATASQQVVDGVSNKDWRGGRGVLENIIPSSTGAAKAVSKVIPAMKNKLSGMALRIPSSDVSVVDLTVELETECSYEEVCTAMKIAANGSLKRVLDYTDEKVVSSDFRGVSAASIFDADAGMMIDSTFLKVIAWYDNEYGYAANLIRLVQRVAEYQQQTIMDTELELSAA